MLMYVQNYSGGWKLFCGNRNRSPKRGDYFCLRWAYRIYKGNCVFWGLLCVFRFRRRFRFACSTCSKGLAGDPSCPKETPTSFHTFVVQPGDLFHSLSKNYFPQKEKAQTCLQKLLIWILPSGVFISVCSYNVTVQSWDDLSYSIVFPEYLITVVKPTLQLWT